MRREKIYSRPGSLCIRVSDLCWGYGVGGWVSGWVEVVQA
jgi:hypothetical protein